MEGSEQQKKNWKSQLCRNTVVTHHMIVFYNYELAR